jgi:hypothetical protein
MWSSYYGQVYSMSYLGKYETNKASFKTITQEISPITFISAIFKETSVQQGYVLHNNAQVADVIVLYL